MVALAPLNISEDLALHKQLADSPFPVLGQLDDDPRYENPAVELAEPQLAVEISPEEQRMQELERMLQEAQGHAAVVEREAYDKAYASGEKAGMALGEKRAEQTLDALDALVLQVETQLQHLEQLCSDAVLDISRSVMQHVLGAMTEQQDELLVAAVQRAALQFPELSGLTISLSPDDIQSFEAILSEKKINDWRLQSDPNLASGSCRLISKQQDVLINPQEAMQASLEALRVRMQA